MSEELISIKEAVVQEIDRLRRHVWVNKLDHIKINIIYNSLGPWVHLYAPFNKVCNGRDPVSMLIIEMDTETKEWLPYTGPLPDSEEYKNACKEFGEFLEETPNET